MLKQTNGFPVTPSRNRQTVGGNQSRLGEYVSSAFYLDYLMPQLRFLGGMPGK